MNKMLLRFTCSLAMSVLFFACSSDDDSTGSGTVVDSAPDVYEFYDVDGNSTVVYSGQVVRNVLITDIKALANSTDASLLEGMYTNSEANQSRAITSLSDQSTVQTTYGDISGSNLNGKIAKVADDYGVADETVYGYNMEPDALMSTWFSAAASGSYNSDGLDIGQMIQKGLMGMVSYYQGTSKYLGVVLEQDNSGPDGDNYYTKMEHYWDESFGYFGASADYLSRTDAEIKASTYFDTDNDGSIDFLSENCTGISINAAKRDDGSSNYYDFTGTIMSAYLEGRYLISTGGSESDIIAQREIIVNNWEMLLAANTIHYINDTMGDIGDGSGWEVTWDASCTSTETKCSNYSKHYSEMRAFAMGLQYNRYKLISDSDLNQVYDLMRVAPEFPETTGDLSGMLSYMADLQVARDILEAAYGFDSSVVANW